MQESFTKIKKLRYQALKKITYKYYGMGKYSENSSQASTSLYLNWIRILLTFICSSATDRNIFVSLWAKKHMVRPLISFKQNCDRSCSDKGSSKSKILPEHIQLKESSMYWFCSSAQSALWRGNKRYWREYFCTLKHTNYSS